MLLKDVTPGGLSIGQCFYNIYGCLQDRRRMTYAESSKELWLDMLKATKLQVMAKRHSKVFTTVLIANHGLSCIQSAQKLHHLYGHETRWEHMNTCNAHVQMINKSP